MKTVNTLISVAVLAACMPAMSQVIWQANRETCPTQRSSGIYTDCKIQNFEIKVPATDVHGQAIPEGKRLPETVTPSTNAFIKTLQFVTEISYIYPCAGREDETYLLLDQQKELTPWTEGSKKVKFYHDLEPTLKLHFVRNSRLNSSISNRCYFEMQDHSTVLANPASLKEYVQSQVTVIDRVQKSLDKLSNTVDLVLVQNALADAYRVASNEASGLDNEKFELEMKLQDASEEEAVIIQEKIDLLLPKIIDIDQLLTKLANAKAVLAGVCTLATSGSQECKNVITEILADIYDLKRLVGSELKNEILPWINAELERLGSKQTETISALNDLKKKIGNP